ncbi:hypothetical protein [Raineyella sp. W15-4]|uniref:hypothetical protein n=1 Tax=Raineyella sp. W15-4 TaxID=3081651 RepID=UPI00295374FE|nr:hypothetical protein [Raineyella sp. W15-4]WOQ16464.1 hypothetical protein R0145_14850 [Raineyella sp. W15-4]
MNEALRAHARAAIDALTDPAPYAPDADMEDFSHLEVVSADLEDTDLAESIRVGASLPLATVDELRSGHVRFHAALVGEGDDATIFIRKRSPVQSATASVVATLFNSALDRVTTPLFAFDDRYDAIITPETVYVLDKTAFEGLFKSSPAVLATIGEKVAALAVAVPMTEGSSEILEGALQRNQYLRRKFFATSGRPYLPTITADMLRAEIIRSGGDPAEFMDGDQLMITAKNIKMVLQILNEDLFSGVFSQAHYAASSKRTLR